MGTLTHTHTHTNTHTHTPQLSCLPRGQMVHADPGRHLFDVSMFRLMWQPTVTAMAAIVESAPVPPLAQVRVCLCVLVCVCVFVVYAFVWGGGGGKACVCVEGGVDVWWVRGLGVCVCTYK